MIGMTIILDGNNAWPDLKEKDVVHVENMTVAACEGGTASGHPAVAIRFELPDGQTVVATTTARLFCSAGLPFSPSSPTCSKTAQKGGSTRESIMEARERTIRELMQDDAALTYKQAKALYDQASSAEQSDGMLPRLIEELRGVVRILDAVKLQVGLGKSQLARLESAKVLLESVGAK